jgi:hypothetical protein
VKRVKSGSFEKKLCAGEVLFCIQDGYPVFLTQHDDKSENENRNFNAYVLQPLGIDVGRRYGGTKKVFIGGVRIYGWYAFAPKPLTGKSPS